MKAIVIIKGIRLPIGCRVWLLLLLTVGLPLRFLAQESQYARMVREMDTRSLPLVNLTVDTSQVCAESFVEGAIEIADLQRRTDPSSDTVRFHCLVRYRGTNALLHRKKSFAVKLIDGQGDDLDAPVLGIREENSWILNAMAIDRARMRNLVCFDVWNEMSRTPYATKYGNRNGIKGHFVELFVNGDYQGLYCLSDKVDRKLLGLKKVEGDSTGVTYKGLLYKGVNWESGCDLLSYEDDPDVEDGQWNAFELQYPQDRSTPEAWRPLMDLIDFCSYQTSDSVFLAHYRDYFDVGNLADFVAFTWAMNVGDNAYKNTFLSVPDIRQGHRFLLTPWDMDMSLGGHWDGSYNDVPVDMIYLWARAPFDRLLMRNLDGFADSVAARYRECFYGVLSEKHVVGIMRDYATQLMESGAWGREVAKWDGDPVPLRTSVFDEVDYIAGWYWRNQAVIGWQIGFDDVHEVAGDLQPSGGDIHAVDGRKISIGDGRELPKGIYIQNGRKFVVK